MTARSEFTEDELMDHARIKKDQRNRGIPSDWWARRHEGQWHMVDAWSVYDYVAHCGEFVPRTGSAYGEWRSGHWPTNSCSKCMEVMEATRHRIDNRYVPKDHLADAVDRWLETNR